MEEVGKKFFQSLFFQATEAFYISSASTSYPLRSNEESMELAFGNGNWQALTVGSLVDEDIRLIFSSTTKYVFVDMSSGASPYWNLIWSAQKDLIRAWVKSGGRLFMNCWTSDSFTSSLIDETFVGWTPATASSIFPQYSKASHPIFTSDVGLAPFQSPSGGPISESHVYIVEPEDPNIFYSKFAFSDAGMDILAEVRYYEGRFILGGIPPPQAFADPLRATRLFVAIHKAKPLCMYGKRRVHRRRRRRGKEGEARGGAARGRRGGREEREDQGGARRGEARGREKGK
jgi:hypothetical protein